MAQAESPIAPAAQRNARAKPVRLVKDLYSGFPGGRQKRMRAANDRTETSITKREPGRSDLAITTYDNDSGTGRMT